MSATDLPANLAANPRLDRWIRFMPAGRVWLATGKVELGQGNLTALVQMAAEELVVRPERISIVSGDTGETPDEGFTTGSQSIEASGAAIRAAAAEVRARFLDAAALRLNCAPAALGIADGTIIRDGASTVLDYWSLAPAVDLTRAAVGGAPLTRPENFTIIGTSLPRIDLPGKVFGAAAFLHDEAWDTVLHARALHPPRLGAHLAPLVAQALAGAAGASVELFRLGDFAAVLGEDEAAVERAHEVAERRAVWSGGRPWQLGDDDPLKLTRLPSLDEVREFPGHSSAGPAVRQISRRYTRPYLAHAAIGPSVAVAEWDGSRLDVSTHSQGVFALREALARALGLLPAAISVRHRQGAGCYGHNGADDAALDAALIARARPGRPVRVQWSRAQELAAAPFGSASVVDLAATLDAHGRPVTWSIEVWSGMHGVRPGRYGAVNLLAAAALPNPPPPPAIGDVPEAGGFGGLRNAVALYDLPPQRVVHHLIGETPLRTSSMRGLGAHANVFAIESFIDELALAARADPLAYRLSLLTDRRAWRVLERVAGMAGWSSRPPGGQGHGFGIAFSRYKNRAAYLAAIAEVEAGEEVRLVRISCAVDAGLVINPDGAANQIEGGIIQAASWTLKEAVRVDTDGIATASWEQYPILSFPEVPEIAVEFCGEVGSPALGLGEAALGPTAAAIGNAIADALGARIRAMPFTRDRLAAALLGAGEGVGGLPCG